jgi:hypothetical protein
MTERLFHPTAYARPGASSRDERPTRPRAEPNVVRSDDGWFAITGTKKMHAYAHRLTPQAGGVARALCGVVGRAIAIPTGAIVTVCPTCADAEEWSHERRARA